MTSFDICGKHVKIVATAKTGIVDEYNGPNRKPYLVKLDDPSSKPMFVSCTRKEIELTGLACTCKYTYGYDSPSCPVHGRFSKGEKDETESVSEQKISEFAVSVFEMLKAFAEKNSGTRDDPKPNTMSYRFGKIVLSFSAKEVL